MRTYVGTFALLAICATAARASAQSAAPGATPPATDPASTAVASGRAAPAADPSLSIGATAPALRGPTVWGILPWGGVGIGARFMMPLSIRPLLSGTSVRDSFALELGADVLHWSYDVGVPGFGYSYSWTEVLPVAGIMWNLWLNDRFAFYPKAELGYAFGWFSGLGSNEALASYGGVFVDGAVGALYNVGGGLTLRAEAGSAGLRLGAGWLF